LADIVDKRINIATESNRISIQTEKLKMISAGDSILINAKNEKPFSYTPSAKLVFAMNHLPSTTDTSDGFMDRLIILPFRNKYVYEPTNPWERIIDPDLLDRLTEELDGILVFALEGLQRLIANKYRFTQSQESNAILQHFKATVNPFIDFINLELRKGPDFKVEKTIVYQFFKKWAGSNGYSQFSGITAHAFYQEFVATMQSLNVPCAERKIKGNRLFVGFKLKAPSF
jgi:putative DNA primase/helicase